MDTQLKMCPYCSVPLSLTSDTCFACKRKVGKVNKYGMAEKPPKYGTYFTCLLSWAGFYVYMHWAFAP